MTRFMFRALNELKSDIIVVDKLLETTSTANYSKSAHRIKNVHMQNMSLLFYITHLVACQCSQLHARAKNLIQQSQSQPTKWMPITKLQTPSQQEVRGIHRLMYIVSAIIHRTMYCTSIRPVAPTWSFLSHSIKAIQSYHSTRAVIRDK